jgi:hypothetical protein
LGVIVGLPTRPIGSSPTEVLGLDGQTEVDLAGAHILEAIASVCDPAAAFPAQVEAALYGAFAFSVGEPQRVMALLDHNRSEDVLLYEAGWRTAFADRLRAAAKRQSGLAPPPLFLESFLVCEVEERLCHWLRGGQEQPLGDFVRDQREFILGYYAPRAQPAA